MASSLWMYEIGELKELLASSGEAKPAGESVRPEFFEFGLQALSLALSVRLATCAVKQLAECLTDIETTGEGVLLCPVLASAQPALLDVSRLLSVDKTTPLLDVIKQKISNVSSHDLWGALVEDPADLPAGSLLVTKRLRLPFQTELQLAFLEVSRLPA